MVSGVNRSHYMLGVIGYETASSVEFIIIKYCYCHYYYYYYYCIIIIIIGIGYETSSSVKL